MSEVSKASEVKNSSKSTYFAKVIALQNPIAAQIFVFLRHKVRSYAIDELGYVNKSLVAKYLKINMGNLENIIHQYNVHSNSTPERQIYEDDSKTKVRVMTCHSIRKVNEEKILDKVDIKFNTLGYKYLKSDNRHKYKKGDDFRPTLRKNCCVFDSKIDNHIDIAKYHALLTFDLYNLVKDTNKSVLTLTGDIYYYRGKIAAKYIKYKLL